MNEEQHRKVIEDRLGLVRARIRRLQWVRGALVVGSVFLGGLLLAMAADLVFAPLPQAARWVIFFAWLAAVLISIRVGWSPLFRPISLIKIARWLENRHPEMQERLSTSLELAGDQDVSPGLMAALLEAAEADAGTVDPRLEVHAGSSTKKWRWLAVGFAVVILGALVAMPSQTGRLLLRAMAPFSKTGNALAAYFELKPGDIEVLEGDPVRIEVGYTGPDMPVELVMDFESGNRITQPLATTESGLVYELDPARKSFAYKARAGRAESDAFTVTVWPVPQLVDPRLQLQFPPYTGLPPREENFSRPIEAVIGTTVRLQADLNTPVESARLMFGENRLDGAIEASASGGRLAFEWTLGPETSGEGVVWLQHRLDRELEAFRFEIQAIEDQPPTVVLLSPTRDEIRVRPDELLQIRYEITEDFGVASVTLEAESGKKKSIEQKQTLPEKLPGLEPARYRGGIEVPVGAMMRGFDGAREFKLRVKATDARPVDMDGPGRGESKWLIVRIEDGAETLARQKLFAEHSDTRETIEKAMQKTREARDRMNQVRDPMIRGEKEESMKQPAAEAREKLAEAERMLEELIPRMEEGIHAAQVEEVREAVELLTESRENFEETPLQDAQEQRAEKMDQARQSADEAIAKLEALRDEVNRERPKIEDLARIEDLAQRQQELARQAAETANSPETPETPTDEWRKNQEQVEQQLRQELQKRPEAFAEALARQAEQASELAEKAREMSETQQDLQKLSADLAEQPEPAQLNADQLRQALAEEQKQVAAEAKSQAEEAAAEMAANTEEGKPSPQSPEQLADAAQKAEAAGQEMERNDMAKAAETASEAAESMKQASEQQAAEEQAAAESAASSEAGQLAQRQEQIAEAAKALAEGNLEQAAEHLQAAQEAQSDSLAEMLAEALAQEQAAIAQEANEQLVDARQQRNEMADILPESAAAAQEAKEALDQGVSEAAAEAAKQAASTMESAASQASEAAQATAEAKAPAAAQAQAAAQAEQLGDLAERQAQVAAATEALAAGDMAAAIEQMQAMNAAKASELATEVASMPELMGSQLGEAAQRAQQGERHAEAAAEQSQQANAQAAAQENAQSGSQFAQAAEALDRAAAQISERAEQLAAQSADPNQAPVGSGALAEAMMQAALSAESPSPGEAAQAASQAAQALAQAAQQGRAEMQGKPSPPTPGEPKPGQPKPGEPSEMASESGEHSPQADPGVPPQLARLGISAEDWVKIQATLSSDVGAGGKGAVPEDYRGLVKDYFQNMAKDQ